MNASKNKLDVYLYAGGNTVNPYLYILGNALKKLYPQINIRTGGGLGLNLARPSAASGTDDVIHIHWLPEFYPKTKGLFKATLLYWKIIVHFLLIASMKFWRGAKVVWTVHHTNRQHLRPFWTSLFYRWTNTLANAYIFHCESSRNEFFRNFRSSTSEISEKKPCFVIPHGNFIDAYGPVFEDQAAARKYFNLPQEQTVFLVLGMMRGSKNLEWLFEPLRKLADKRSDLCFWIAGLPLTKTDEAIMNQYKNAPGFVIMPDFVAPELFPKVFAAADFLLNPQTRGYVSGIAIAALSYSLPVLQIDWGCGSDIVQNGANGFIFSKETLLPAIEKAAAAKSELAQHEKMRQAAHDSAKRLDWKIIAEETFSAYGKILNAER